MAESSSAAAMEGPLSQEQIKTYRDTGFLHVSDLLTEEEKQGLLKFTEDLQNWPESSGTYMKYYELSVDGNRQLCRIENFVPFHEGLRLLLEKKVTAASSQLFNEQAVLYKDKINFKLPKGSGFKPHQDAPAFVTFKQKNHLSVMIAVDAATPENGCLEAVPGDWEGTLYPHPGGELEPSLVEGWDKEGRWGPIITKIGDVVFFSSFLPHRSGPNLSSGPRRTYYLTYNSASDGDHREGYYQDKRKMFPPESERDPSKDYTEGAKIYNLANPIL